jgi:exopolyphosphatase/guanosine-5'-triphosphate,3'-diphosphate pyrophosphatase
MMETILASIDIGSHTARLLVCKKSGVSKHIRPLLRERAYIRLAEDFASQGKRVIQPEATERALKALGEFASITEKMGVENVLAACTGVVREAENRKDFLNQIYEHTGIQAHVLSGEEEALLTARGVLNALGVQGRVSMIFDLGGGSTEFIYGEQDPQKTQSLPLGAMVLTQKYLVSDPPGEQEMGALEQEVDNVLSRAFHEGHMEGDGLVVGTGGTVTTLGAMLHGMDVEEISPQRMNGLKLEREQLEDLFQRLKAVTFEERLKLQGLDRGRADVIPAGCAVVLRILSFFKTREIVVSLSDLLEGLAIEDSDFSVQSLGKKPGGDLFLIPER